MVGNRPQNGKKTMNPKSLRKFFQNASAKDWSNWRWQMQNRVTLPEKLPDFHDISPVLKEEMRKVLPSYPMAVTPYFLSLISEYDGLGPVAAQCLPNIKEIKIFENFPKDPLGEDGNMPIPKLIHRYPDRVLAMVTQTCATYCRHCNRKRFWKTPQNFPLQKHLQQMVRYVAESPSIREVIISGGDPLTFDDAKLEMILDSFSTIPSVEILRIGSRMPSVLPMRITNDLCRMLKRYRPLWFNTQFNHPDEITKDAADACQKIQEAGIPVSNQAVLLKGINDNPDVMARLLSSLQKISVRPYYLFHCEPVRGCGHFRTDLAQGLSMMETLRKNCSGLALPQYVADLPGESGKVPILTLSKALKMDLQKHQDFFDNSQ